METRRNRWSYLVSCKKRAQLSVGKSSSLSLEPAHLETAVDS